MDTPTHSLKKRLLDYMPLALLENLPYCITGFPESTENIQRFVRAAQIFCRRRPSRLMPEEPLQFPPVPCKIRSPRRSGNLAPERAAVTQSDFEPCTRRAFWAASNVNFYRPVSCYDPHPISSLFFGHCPVPIIAPPRSPSFLSCEDASNGRKS